MTPIEVLELKKVVLNYIEEADERLLEMMLSLAENYEQELTTAYTEEDYEKCIKVKTFIS